MVPGFQPLGLGIVSENKPSGEWYASVFLIEQSQLGDADINSKEKSDITIELANGGTKKISVKPDYKVKAKWLRVGDTQRITPPDLYINQKVLVYNKPGYDEYYWIPVFLENEIRVNEEVTYGFMARHKDDKAEMDASFLEKMYRLAISTETGEVRWSTSTANEEQTAYTLFMDTKNGLMGYEDKQGNYWMLDSPNGTIKSNLLKDNNLKISESRNTLISKNDVLKVGGNSFGLISGATMIKSDGEVGYKTKGSTTFENNGEVNLKAVKNIQVQSLDSVLINGNKDVHILSNGGKVSIVAPGGLSILAPTIDLVGAVQTGAFSCLALSVGGAAPQPPQLVQPQIKALETKDLDDAMKNLEEIFKEKKEDESGGGSSGGKTRSARSGQEEEKDPWADKTEPQKPEPLEEPTVSKSTMEKEAEILASKGLTINSDAKIHLNGGPEMKVTGNITSIAGDQGISIKGVTGDLVDLLIEVVTELAAAIDSPHNFTGGNSGGPVMGPTIPAMKGSEALAKLTVKLTQWKGGATRAASLTDDEIQGD